MPPRTPIIPSKPLLSLLTAASSTTSPSTPYICTTCLTRTRTRSIHIKPQHPVPSPTPFVPNQATFLTLIGRDLSKHASKFPDWPSLFTLTSEQLQNLGIEPARSRRYLLRWRDKFRKGEFGIGGDCQYVDENGVAELRVVELPALPGKGIDTTGGSYASAMRTPGMQKLILNVPASSTADTSSEMAADTSTTTSEAPASTSTTSSPPPLKPFSYQSLPGSPSPSTLRKPAGLKLLRGHIISAPYITYIKGSNFSAARLKVQEGMWEDKRGHKVDGGERRRAEVKFKRNVAERKARRR